VRGFVSPLIGEALPFDPAQGFVGADLVIDPETDAVGVAEVELGEIAAKTGFADVVERPPRLRIEK
jgi:hypothetical protein